MRTNRNCRCSQVAAIVFAFVVLTLASVGQSPSPPGDKDLESVMTNLNDEVKAFRPRFEAALKKSTIRRTSEAKDARNLASGFQQQTAALMNEPKQTNNAGSLQSVLSTADQLEKLIHDLKLDPRALGWDKVRADLNQVSSAFGIAPAAVDSPQSKSISCQQAVGAERSKKLVDECLQVSPATHPPCNSQNSCQLIIDEIKRSCSLLGPSKPGFCAEYE